LFLAFAFWFAEKSRDCFGAGVAGVLLLGLRLMLKRVWGRASSDSTLPLFERLLAGEPTAARDIERYEAQLRASGKVAKKARYAGIFRKAH
jgi:hypothetical protein